MHSQLSVCCLRRYFEVIIVVIGGVNGSTAAIVATAIGLRRLRLDFA